MVLQDANDSLLELTEASISPLAAVLHKGVCVVWVRCCGVKIKRKKY